MLIFDFFLFFAEDDILVPPPVQGGDKTNKNSSSLYDYVTPEVMSTVVGAALGDQDCLRYSACKAGNYVADVTGKEIVLM